MKQCAFLTMSGLSDHHVADDHLLIEPLSQKGWQVTWVPWRQHGVDWKKFDVVIVRSPWDYQEDHQKFLQVLAEISQAGVTLANNLEAVTWNLNKGYLQDLADKGLSVVPTRFCNPVTETEISLAMEAFGVNELVVKPRISASADHTYRVTGDSTAEVIEKLTQVTDRQGFLLQPFLPSIQTQGEVSLFYLGGKYSHAISKTPKPGDFRSQEEHGGILQAIEPNPEHVALGDRLMAAYPDLLYGRLDLVLDQTSQWCIMELELIEPSLYFRLDPDSPARFASALEAWMDKTSKEKS